MSETEMTTFADALNPAPPEEASTAGSTEKVTEAPATKPEATVTKAAEGDVDTEETESSPNVDPVKQAAGFKAAMIAERKRAQKAEEIITKMIAQQQPPQSTTPQPVQPTTYYEDPEKYVQQSVGETKVAVANMSEVIARQVHSDYDDKLAAYRQIAEANPELHHRVMNSLNPAEEAYQLGKRTLFEKEYGSDPETIMKNAETKLREKVRAEVEAELTGKVARKQNQPTDILAGRAAGGDTTPEWQPTSFGMALRRKK